MCDDEFDEEEAFALLVMLLSIVVGIRPTRMTLDRRGTYTSWLDAIFFGKFQA